MRAAGSAPEKVLIKIIDNASEECVKQKNRSDVTILHHISLFSRSSALRRVLAVNADNVNTRDTRGLTPLHLCLNDGWRSFEEQRETAKILMEFGAMPTIKSKDGYTPIDLYKLNPCSKYDKNLKSKQKKELLKILEEQWIPTEIIARGEEAINAFKDELKNGKTTLVNSRIMVLGKEGVGKTSAVNRILNKRFNKKETSTDGIVTTTVFQTIEGQDDRSSLSWNWLPGRRRNYQRFKWKEQNADVTGVTREIYQHTVVENIAKKFRNTNEPEPNTTSVKSTSSNLASTSSFGHHRPTSKSVTHFKEDLQSATSVISGDIEKRHETTERLPAEFENLILEKKTQHLNDIPEEIRLKVYDQLRNPSQKLETKDFTTIMDYAGQTVYYITHRFYLTNGSVYVVVFSLADNLNDLAKSRDVNKGPFEMTNLQMIVFWIRSTYEHAILPYESEWKKMINDRIASPPIILLGTHKDKLKGSKEKKEKMIEAMLNQILDEIKNTPYEKHVRREIFVVDNTKGFDEGIEKLKEIASGYMRSMAREIPVSWIDLQSKIQEHAETRLCMSKDEISKTAAECEVSETETALRYLNDSGIVLYSNRNEKLKNTVVTNLPMMIDMLRKIITAVEANDIHEFPVLMSLWKKFDEEGILDEKLLNHLWRDFIKKDSTVFEVFVEVTKIFSLLFEKKDEQGNRVFLVPCRMKTTTDSLEVKKDDKQTASVYVTPTDFLPDSVYSVLVVGLLNFMEKKGRSTKSKHKKLFQNRSDFDLYDDHCVSLGAVKIGRRHALKLEISRLPAFDEDGTEVRHTPRPSVCLEILTYLKKQLEMVYGTNEGIGYNLHVICYMCPSKASTLSSLHKLDECLSKDNIRCDDKVVSTAHFKQLFAGSKEEQNVIQTSAGKQNVTERTKATKEQFRSLLSEFSEQYRGSKYHWLRFLLFDHLPIDVLSTKDSNGLALFNELETLGHISRSNVIILSEICDTTKVEKAKSYIAEYTRAYECEEGAVLSKSRIALFNALREVAQDELPRLIDHYQIRHYQKQFQDVFDVTYYLEKERLLDNTPDKWQRFGKLLNGKAKEIMLGSTRTPGSTSRSTSDSTSTNCRCKIL